MRSPIATSPPSRSLTDTWFGGSKNEHTITNRFNNELHKQLPRLHPTWDNPIAALGVSTCNRLVIICSTQIIIYSTWDISCRAERAYSKRSWLISRNESDGLCVPSACLDEKKANFVSFLWHVHKSSMPSEKTKETRARIELRTTKLRNLRTTNVLPALQQRRIRESIAKFSSIRSCDASFSSSLLESSTWQKRTRLYGRGIEIILICFQLPVSSSCTLTASCVLHIH